METVEQAIERLAALGLSFGPPPPWAVDRPIPAPIDDDEGGSVRFLLSDHALDLVGERTWTRRSVRSPRHSEGLGKVAQWGFAFDPVHTRAVVHRMEVRRECVAPRALDPRSVVLLRREPQLERQIYRWLADR